MADAMSSMTRTTTGANSDETETHRGKYSSNEDSDVKVFDFQYF